ncbi:unnamed protein product [Rhizophagus irregularis]|nr:unnamed protein product [Rhizophagus irregularis]
MLLAKFRRGLKKRYNYAVTRSVTVTNLIFFIKTLFTVYTDCPACHILFMLSGIPGYPILNSSSINFCPT